jgi:hypothetical protein
MGHWRECGNGDGSGQHSQQLAASVIVPVGFCQLPILFSAVITSRAMVARAGRNIVTFL